MISFHAGVRCNIFFTPLISKCRAAPCCTGLILPSESSRPKVLKGKAIKIAFSYFIFSAFD